MRHKQQKCSYQLGLYKIYKTLYFKLEQTRKIVCSGVVWWLGIISNHFCDPSDISDNSLMILTPVLADHGAWTCAVNDDRSLETIKDYRHLDIVVEGQISLSPSNTVLELVEGDMADLLCSVEEGFPKPDISWGVDRELWGVLNTGSQVGGKSSFVEITIYF